MNTGTFKTSTRYLYAIAFLLIAIVSYSCNDSNGFEGEEPVESTMSFQMRGANAEKLEKFVDNTSIYMFDDGNHFVEKKLNVRREGNTLSTNVAVGTWNIVLLTCDEEDFVNNISVPVRGTPIANAPMWETKLLPGGNFLSQTPGELRYALLPSVEIEKDLTKRINTLLYRNVAKIQVILKHYDGFDELTPDNASMAYAELLDVPTILRWDGKLYPNGTSPHTSGLIPIRENFIFDTTGKADTLNFIVPAHRGSDAFTIQDGELKPNPSPTDLSTHKLKLRVSMPLGNEEYYGRSTNGIEIPHVPQPNKIIRVFVTFYGTTTLDINIDVKDWEDWIYQDEEFD